MILPFSLNGQTGSCSTLTSLSMLSVVTKRRMR